MYKTFLKRKFDIVVSFLLIILFSPLYILITLILFVTTTRKIFFIQKRPGLNETIFRLVKFKTMNDRRDQSGDLLSDNLRLTQVGRFLRNTSLDELPQLFNVLIGNMSLIGPRPLLVEYLDLYNEKQRKRHLVRPGITGWAQVNGRNAISWNEKFELDIWYIENLSFLIDIKIIFLTFNTIFLKKGVNADTSQTMPKFTGKND